MEPDAKVSAAQQVRQMPDEHPDVAHLREVFDLRLKNLERLIEERRVADDKALALVKELVESVDAETKRRLEELNHERARESARNANYTGNDVFNARSREIDGKIEALKESTDTKINATATAAEIRVKELARQLEDHKTVSAAALEAYKTANALEHGSTKRLVYIGVGIVLVVSVVFVLVIRGITGVPIAGVAQ